EGGTLLRDRGERLARRLEHGSLARERLPPRHDDVGVECIDLHKEGLALGRLAADERAAATAEKVEDVLTAPAAVEDRARGQLDGLFREVDHALWADLLDRPKVGGVVRPEVLVRGTLAPAVEAPLVRAHEVLARQDGVLLVPDDRLAEVEPGAFQGSRVVGAVAVAAPEIEGAARQQDAADVAEPRPEQPRELLLRHEVIRQRPVLRAQLPRRALGLV